MKTYTEAALKYVESLPSGTLFDADQVRGNVGVPDPSHQANGKNNGIGPIYGLLKTLGLAEGTGTYRPSRSPERHGGKNQIWKRL